MITSDLPDQLTKQEGSYRSPPLGEDATALVLGIRDPGRRTMIVPQFPPPKYIRQYLTWSSAPLFCATEDSYVHNALRNWDVDAKYVVLDCADTFLWKGISEAPARFKFSSGKVRKPETDVSSLKSMQLFLTHPVGQQKVNPGLIGLIVCMR